MDDRALRRKQANRDSARRSKQRKKEENEATLLHAQALKREHEALKREIATLEQRVASLQALHDKLKAQVQQIGGVDL